VHTRSSAGLRRDFISTQSHGGENHRSANVGARPQNQLHDRVGRGAWCAAVAAVRVPHATVCLLSALDRQDLADGTPSRVDLAVARGRNRPHIGYPPVEVHVFDADTFDLGRELVEVVLA
jgi:hypothetical protein